MKTEIDPSKPIETPSKTNLALTSPTSHAFGVPLGRHALERIAGRAKAAPEPERFCTLAISEVMLLASHKPALIVLAIMRAYQPEPGLRLDEIGRRCRFGQTRASNAVAKLMALGLVEAMPPTGKAPMFTLTQGGRGPIPPSSTHASQNNGL